MLSGGRGGHKPEVDVQDALWRDLVGRLEHTHTAVVNQIKPCRKRCVSDVCDFVGALDVLAGRVGRRVQEGHGRVDAARVGALGAAGLELADETAAAAAVSTDGREGN